jgi:hypothetical protein
MPSTPFPSPQVVSRTFALFRVVRFHVSAAHDLFWGGFDSRQLYQHGGLPLLCANWLPSTVTSRNTSRHIRSTRRTCITTRGYGKCRSEPISAVLLRGSNPLSSTSSTPWRPYSNSGLVRRGAGYRDQRLGFVPDGRMVRLMAVSTAYRSRDYARALFGNYASSRRARATASINAARARRSLHPRSTVSERYGPVL